MSYQPEVLVPTAWLCCVEPQRLCGDQCSFKGKAKVKKYAVLQYYSTRCNKGDHYTHEYTDEHIHIDEGIDTKANYEEDKTKLYSFLLVYRLL